jgi:hypothetical protein
MDLEINKSTIKSTTKCEKSFRCLNGDKKGLCDVEFIAPDQIAFVRCSDIEDCNYRMNFGYSHICNCPVRKEIYKRYNY